MSKWRDTRVDLKFLQSILLSLHSTKARKKISFVD